MLLLLSACSLFNRPEPTLLKAREAYEQKDLQAFEALVDLDAVAPQAAEGCMKLTMLGGWTEEQFQPRSSWAELGQDLGEGLLQGLISLSGPEIAEQARQDFGSRSLEELCPAIQQGDLAKARTTRFEGGADVAVPVLVHGEPTAVVVHMQDFEGGWRITGLDFGRAETEYRALQETRAEARAQSLLAGLEKELKRDTWQQLDVYVERHPDSPVAAGLHELVGELLEAPTPVTVESAWLYKKGLLGFRQAHARLRNEGEQPITSLSLRFTLRDDGGRKVRNVNGEDHLSGPVSLRLAPGEVEEVALAGASMLSWPNSTKAEAVVTELRYADGARWEHPARTAGLW